jgi:hypothetical protein
VREGGERKKNDGKLKGGILRKKEEEKVKEKNERKKESREQLTPTHKKEERWTELEGRESESVDPGGGRLAPPSLPH